MKKFYLILLFFSITAMLKAQAGRIDSLKLILEKTTKVDTKLSTLESLNKILISESSLEEALPFFLEMSSIAKDLNNDELETRAYKYISETYMKKMDSVKSLEFAKKALVINRNNNNLHNYLLDINQLGRVYYHFQYYEKALKTYNIGILLSRDDWDDELLIVVSKLHSNSSSAYDKLGRADESIEAILKGVEIAEKTNDIDERSYGLYVLGYMYMDLKNYDKAEEYFLKSLTLSDSVSLQTYVKITHHALGINYSRWNKYDKALYHNKIALDFFRKQNDKLYEFDVLNNTALVYQRMKIADSVIKYGKLALNIAKEINHKLAISGAKLTLSNAYINLENYNKAEQLLLEVAIDTINTDIIDKNSKMSIYSNFSEIYEGQKKYKKSLEFHKKLKILNDSIQKEVQDSKLLETESKYRLEQKNNKILLQSLMLEENSKERYQLILFISMTFLFTLFLLVLLYRRRKQFKIEKYKYNQELKRGTRLREMVQRLKKEPQGVDGIDDSKFHEFIKQRIKINDDLLQVYLELVKDKSYNEISNNINLSLNGTKTRINKLYTALKISSKIDIDKKITKSQSAEIFNNLFIDYQIDK